MKFACDFETTTTESFIKEGKVRVWSWQGRNIDTLEIDAQGTNIDSFMEWVINRGRSCDMYFHNLKFDGGFIIDALLKRGWTHVDDGAKPYSKQFDTIITDAGAFFQITLYLKIHKKRYVKVDIKDSSKKIPLSIERIARAFNLDTLKGDIDYHKYRPEGYEPTKEEWEYLDNDTLILAQALKQTFSQGMEKLTIAGDAMYSYKETLPENMFEKLYPTLDRETDNFIRASYKGGFVYVKPEFAGMVFEKTTSYDVNSLFPSVMYNDLLPYSVPKPFTGKYEYDETHPLYIQHIRVDFEVKEKHIPTIQAKGNPRFQPTTYLTNSEGEALDLYLTNIDLELFLKHHEVYYIEYVGGFKFKGARGLFKDYIDYWSAIKETSTGGQRQLAKLMLNSLYGKFAQRPERRRKIPRLENGVVKYEIYESEDVDPIYTAMSSFITAYARLKTIGSAQENYDRFIYADTDSIHLVGHDVPDNLEIHDTKLGLWGCEGLFKDSKFIRPKTYIKIDDEDKLVITCAGLPNEARKHVTFENFKVGASYEGKLSNTVVKGGTLLRESTFTISG